MENKFGRVWRRTQRPNESKTAAEFFRRTFSNIQILREEEKGPLITEQYQYPLPTFLSGVGGTLGLWLGASLAGLCEILELFWILCKYLSHLPCFVW